MIKECVKKIKILEKNLLNCLEIFIFLNDTRAKIKLDINNHTGSKIKEIKEYTNY